MNLEDDIMQLQSLLDACRVSDFSTNQQDAALQRTISRLSTIAKWSLRKTRIKKTVAGVAATLLLCLLPGHAQSNEHPTANRTALWASIAARTTDTAYTCHNMATIRGWREQMAPVSTCRGIALWNGLSVGAGFAGQKILHRLGWHRLESMPHWMSATGSAVGILYTLKKRR